MLPSYFIFCRDKMNKLDINQYRARYKDLEKVLKMNPEKNRIDWLGELAFITFCHIIAVECFIMEIEGETEEMINKIKRDMKFYGYDSIGGYNGNQSW